MKHFILILFLIIGPGMNAATSDSILVQIDKALDNKHLYEKLRSDRIGSLRQLLDKNSPAEDARSQLYARLYDEYQFYICDSALYYAECELASSRLLRDSKGEIKSRLDMGYVSSIMGLYAEARDYVASIDSRRIPPELKPQYYKCCIRVGESLMNYDSRRGSDYYLDYLVAYRDSLLQILEPGTRDYAVVSAELAMMKGDTPAALDILLGEMPRLKSNTRDVAFVAYTLGAVYESMGDVDNQIRYYAVSALSDICCGVKENLSLRKLATLLFEQGDIDRAYRYIKCSMEDATFSGARIRTLEVSAMLPVIIEAYQQRKQQQNAKLLHYGVMLTVLSLLLLILLAYTFIQMKRLAQARKALKKSVGELQNLNSQLVDSNLQQNRMNRQLAQSNDQKEEYISHFMDLCSVYIDKLENYKKLVNRKIVSGQIDDLQKLTSSEKLVESELRDFYQNFDSTFLFLYPDFVEEFNQLLRPEERFQIRKGEGLNTELRIFALIRLGFTDSARIAGFLRYSSQTIYNYRTRVKNKALDNRSEFEQKVSRIGR